MHLMSLQALATDIYLFTKYDEISPEVTLIECSLAKGPLFMFALCVAVSRT